MTDRRDPRIRQAVTDLALASRPAPTIEEIIDTRPTVQPRSRRSWIVAIATAAAVLVIVGAASILLGGSDGAIVPVSPADTTAAPPDSTTTVPSVTVFRDAGTAEDAGWTLVNASPNPWGMRPGILDGSWVILDPGYQCRDYAGFYNDCGGWGEPLPDAMPVADPTEILWVSKDGVDWTPMALPTFEGKALDQLRANRFSEWAIGGLLWTTTTDREVWVTDDGSTWWQPAWNITFQPSRDLWGARASREGDVIFLTTGTTPLGWVSSDAGRSFRPVESFTRTVTRVVAHWVSSGEFRAILTDNGAGDGLSLWRSTDATAWERVGAITGLESQRWGPLGKGVFSDEALLIPTLGRCSVQLIRSLDGGLTWQPLDGVSEFLTNPYCPHSAAAMDGWILIQTGTQVAVSSDGLDWYFIDSAWLGDSPPRVDGGGYTDEGHVYPNWWMPPIE